MSFLLINVGGASYCTMTFQQVSRAEESRWEFVLRWESGLKLHVFVHLFFLLYLYFPDSLEKRIEQLSPQSPNLPFQCGHPWSEVAWRANLPARAPPMILLYEFGPTN